VIRFTKEQVLELHRDLIESSGGIDGIRDEGLLDSALNMPFLMFANQELYPDIIAKGARLGYGLISNHPFLDGNKRIGVHTMLLFLEFNGFELVYDDNDLINLIMSIASGEKGNEELEDWIRKHVSD